MELQINLISVNHSGFNREVHRDNVLRGLTFQTTINGQPFEYRAKECSSTGKVLMTKTIGIISNYFENLAIGIRAVCSSEKKNEDGKTCHSALLFIPKPERIQIAEIGTKKSQKAKFGLSPGIPAEVLYNIDNWKEAVHNHRGNSLSDKIFNCLKMNILADCLQTVDPNGFCKVTRHFVACNSSRTSRNSMHRPLQRQMRENVIHLAEDNPARRSRDIIRDGMLQIPEFRSPTGGLQAAAAETSGITRRRERQSVKHVKNVLRGGDTNTIPEQFNTITGQFPCIINGQQRIQRDERQFVHERNGKLFFFVASDLDFLENASVYCDGTFKLSNKLHGYEQLYTLTVKFQSADKRRSFCYVVMSVLLKNKCEDTYKEMLIDIQNFFRERHARELKIKRVHSDRELAFVNAVQAVFPQTILILCSVHIDRRLLEKGIEILGGIWKNDDGLKRFRRMIKKVFYLPFVENEGVRKTFYQFLNSIEDLVEPERKNAAKELVAYFDEWYLQNRSIGIRNINYRQAFLDDDFDGDVTNNASESMNHQLNTRIGPGRLTLIRAAEILHELKVDQIGQLVANLDNDINMELRPEYFMAKRVLLARKVRNFDTLTQEQQANRALR